MIAKGFRSGVNFQCEGHLKQDCCAQDKCVQQGSCTAALSSGVL